MRRLWIALAVLSASAHAEVLDATAHGFTSQHRLVLEATPGAAYAALTEEIHLWWDAAHSFGGSPHAFSLDARAGGCFCEKLDGGGSVEHMRVVNARPGKSLTLQGGLGPLQSMGVAGSMKFTFSPHERGSVLEYRYVVGGYTAGGLDALAAAVDQVQLGQLQRLQRYLASGEPLN